MKAQPIIEAINAMLAIDNLFFAPGSSGEQKARAWNELSRCRNALIAELGAINIFIESAPAVRDLAVTAAPSLAVHAVGADPLAVDCPQCGRPGRGLSNCKHCDEFIPMNLSRVDAAGADQEE